MTTIELPGSLGLHTWMVDDEDLEQAAQAHALDNDDTQTTIDVELSNGLIAAASVVYVGNSPHYQHTLLRGTDSLGMRGRFILTVTQTVGADERINPFRYKGNTAFQLDQGCKMTDDELYPLIVSALMSVALSEQRLGRLELEMEET